MPSDLWDLSSQPGIEPRPTVKVPSPNTGPPGNFHLLVLMMFSFAVFVRSFSFDVVSSFILLLISLPLVSDPPKFH